MSLPDLLFLCNSGWFWIVEAVHLIKLFFQTDWCKHLREPGSTYFFDPFQDFDFFHVCVPLCSWTIRQRLHIVKHSFGGTIVDGFTFVSAMQKEKSNNLQRSGACRQHCHAHIHCICISAKSLSICNKASSIE